MADGLTPSASKRYSDAQRHGSYGASLIMRIMDRPLDMQQRPKSVSALWLTWRENDTEKDNLKSNNDLRGCKDAHPSIDLFVRIPNPLYPAPFAAGDKLFARSPLSPTRCIVRREGSRIWERSLRRYISINSSNDGLHYPLISVFFISSSHHPVLPQLSP